MRLLLDLRAPARQQATGRQGAGGGGYFRTASKTRLLISPMVEVCLSMGQTLVSG
jgi:hypothetical protein